MTKTYLKLLTAVVLINAVNFNNPYCMEINGININNTNVLFSNVLQQIKNNKTQIQKCEEHILQYKQKLSNIIQNMEQSIESLKSSLDVINNHPLPINCKCIKTSNTSANDEVNNIVKHNTEKNNIVILINNYNEKINDIQNNINKQIKEFYDNLFGDDLSKFSIILSQCNEEQLSIIYKILSISEVRDYIVQYRSSDNNEINNINNFLNEFSNTNDNNENLIINNIINIVQKCIITKKSDMERTHHFDIFS